MMHFGTKISNVLKIGTVLFCLMCLFFAINTASKYEHQKSEAEIQTKRVKELEEKIHELSTTNQELLQMRTVVMQEKEQMVKEISILQQKCLEYEDWKLAIEKEKLSNNQITNHQSIDDIIDDIKEKLSEVNEAFHTNPSSAIYTNQPIVTEKDNSTIAQPDNKTPND